MAAKITLDGTEYPIHFGYGAIRYLGRIWNLNGPQEVFERFGKLFDGKEAAGSFDQMEAMGWLIIAGISNADQDPPELNAVVDQVMKDPTLMEVVMTEFQRSLPQGNPQPTPKGRKSKKA